MKRICFTIAGLLCFLMLLFTGCTPESQQETVLKINDREVKQSEFMLYLYEATQDFKYIGGTDIWETDFDGQSAEDVVKERTLSTLKTVMLSCENAKRYEVKLSDEDKQKAKENGDTEWDAMPEAVRQEIGITKDQLYKVMEDTLTYAKVYEAVTKDFQSSPTDFAAYLSQNHDDYLKQYTKYTVSSILTKDEATANLVVQSAKEGQDFEALFALYDQDQSEDAQTGGVMETFKAKLDAAFDIDFNLEVGEISQPLKSNEGYFVIRVDSKQAPTEEEITNIAEIDYTALRKRQIFDAELEQWTANAKIEKNEEAWNQAKLIQ